MDYQSQYNKQQPPMTTQPANVVYMQAAPQQQVGPDPTNMTCPHCNAAIVSRMEQQPSMKTHLFCILLCALG